MFAGEGGGENDDNNIFKKRGRGWGGGGGGGGVQCRNFLLMILQDSLSISK